MEKGAPVRWRSPVGYVRREGGSSSIVSTSTYMEYMPKTREKKVSDVPGQKNIQEGQWG